MHMFDIMAEVKMRKWEKDKQEGNIEPKSDEDRICVRDIESLEKQLYADIRRLIARSREENSEERKETLMKAEKLQVQLLARIEKAGGYHLSKFISDEIRDMRAGKAD